MKSKFTRSLVSFVLLVSSLATWSTPSFAMRTIGLEEGSERAKLEERLRKEGRGNRGILSSGLEERVMTVGDLKRRLTRPSSWNMVIVRSGGRERRFQENSQALQDALADAGIRSSLNKSLPATTTRFDEFRLYVQETQSEQEGTVIEVSSEAAADTIGLEEDRRAIGVSRRDLLGAGVGFVAGLLAKPLLDRVATPTPSGARQVLHEELPLNQQEAPIDLEIVPGSVSPSADVDVMVVSQLAPGQDESSSEVIATSLQFAPKRAWYSGEQVVFNLTFKGTMGKLEQSLTPGAFLTVQKVTFTVDLGQAEEDPRLPSVQELVMAGQKIILRGELKQEKVELTSDLNVLGGDSNILVWVNFDRPLTQERRASVTLRNPKVFYAETLPPGTELNIRTPAPSLLGGGLEERLTAKRIFREASPGRLRNILRICGDNGHAPIVAIDHSDLQGHFGIPPYDPDVKTSRDAQMLVIQNMSLYAYGFLIHPHLADPQGNKPADFPKGKVVIAKWEAGGTDRTGKGLPLTQQDEDPRITLDQVSQYASGIKFLVYMDGYAKRGLPSIVRKIGGVVKEAHQRHLPVFIEVLPARVVAIQKPSGDVMTMKDFKEQYPRGYAQWMAEGTIGLAKAIRNIPYDGFKYSFPGTLATDSSGRRVMTDEQIDRNFGRLKKALAGRPAFILSGGDEPDLIDRMMIALNQGLLDAFFIGRGFWKDETKRPTQAERIEGLRSGEARRKYEEARAILQGSPPFYIHAGFTPTEWDQLLQDKGLAGLEELDLSHITWADFEKVLRPLTAADFSSLNLVPLSNQNGVTIWEPYDVAYDTFGFHAAVPKDKVGQDELARGIVRAILDYRGEHFGRNSWNAIRGPFEELVNGHRPTITGAEEPTLSHITWAMVQRTLGAIGTHAAENAANLSVVTVEDSWMDKHAAPSVNTLVSEPSSDPHVTSWTLWVRNDLPKDAQAQAVVRAVLKHKGGRFIGYTWKAIRDQFELLANSRPRKTGLEEAKRREYYAAHPGKLAGLLATADPDGIAHVIATHQGSFAAYRDPDGTKGLRAAFETYRPDSSVPPALEGVVEDKQLLIRHAWDLGAAPVVDALTAKWAFQEAPIGRTVWVRLEGPYTRGKPASNVLEIKDVDLLALDAESARGRTITERRYRAHHVGVKTNVFTDYGEDSDLARQQLDYIQRNAAEADRRDIPYMAEVLYWEQDQDKYQKATDPPTRKAYQTRRVDNAIWWAEKLAEVQGLDLVALEFPGDLQLMEFDTEHRAHVERALTTLREQLGGRWLMISPPEPFETFLKEARLALERGGAAGIFNLAAWSYLRGPFERKPTADPILSTEDKQVLLETVAKDRFGTLVDATHGTGIPIWRGMGFETRDQAQSLLTTGLEEVFDRVIVVASARRYSEIIPYVRGWAQKWDSTIEVVGVSTGAKLRGYLDQGGKNAVVVVDEETVQAGYDLFDVIHSLNPLSDPPRVPILMLIDNVDLTLSTNNSYLRDFIATGEIAAWSNRISASRVQKALDTLKKEAARSRYLQDTLIDLRPGLHLSSVNPKSRIAVYRPYRVLPSALQRAIESWYGPGSPVNISDLSEVLEVRVTRGQGQKTPRIETSLDLKHRKDARKRAKELVQLIIPRLRTAENDSAGELTRQDLFMLAKRDPNVWAAVAWADHQKAFNKRQHLLLDQLEASTGLEEKRLVPIWNGLQNRLMAMDGNSRVVAQSIEDFFDNNPYSSLEDFLGMMRDTGLRGLSPAKKRILLSAVVYRLDRFLSQNRRLREIFKEIYEQEEDLGLRSVALLGLALLSETDKEKDDVFRIARRFLEFARPTHDEDLRRLGMALAILGTKGREEAFAVLEDLAREGSIPSVSEVRSEETQHGRVLRFLWGVKDFALSSDTNTTPWFTSLREKRDFWDALGLTPAVLKEFKENQQQWKKMSHLRPWWHPLSLAVYGVYLTGLEEGLSELLTAASEGLLPLRIEAIGKLGQFFSQTTIEQHNIISFPGVRVLPDLTPVTGLGAIAVVKEEAFGLGNEGAVDSASATHMLPAVGRAMQIAHWNLWNRAGEGLRHGVPRHAQIAPASQAIIYDLGWPTAHTSNDPIVDGTKRTANGQDGGVAVFMVTSEFGKVVPDTLRMEVVHYISPTRVEFSLENDPYDEIFRRIARANHRDPRAYQEWAVDRPYNEPILQAAEMLGMETRRYGDGTIQPSLYMAAFPEKNIIHATRGGGTEAQMVAAPLLNARYPDGRRVWGRCRMVSENYGYEVKLVGGLDGIPYYEPLLDGGGKRIPSGHTGGIANLSREDILALRANGWDDREIRQIGLGEKEFELEDLAPASGDIFLSYVGDPMTDAKGKPLYDWGMDVRGVVRGIQEEKGIVPVDTLAFVAGGARIVRHRYPDRGLGVIAEQLHDQEQVVNLLRKLAVEDPDGAIQQAARQALQAYLPHALNRDLQRQAAYGIAGLAGLEEAGDLDRAKTRQTILDLAPLAEKLLSQPDALQPDFAGLRQWAAQKIPSYLVDLLNSVVLENGLVAIPVKLGEEWHYFLYRDRNRERPAHPQRFARVLNRQENWVENERLRGVVSVEDRLEAFLATREGMEAILWENDKRKTYQAIWVDWDETVTYPGEREEEAGPRRPGLLEPNPQNLRALLRLHKKGVRIAIGTQRGRKRKDILVKAFEGVGATQEDLKGFLAAFEDGAVAYDLGTDQQLWAYDLSELSKQKTLGVVRGRYGQDPDLERIEPGEATEPTSRIRIVFKKAANEEEEERLEAKLMGIVEELNEAFPALDADQKLEARYDAGASEPRITIRLKGTSKTIGLRQFSEKIDVPDSRIKKYGDRGESGQEKVKPGEDPWLRQQNDWAVLRLEGGGGVGSADSSAVFPALSEKKYDQGLLELLSTDSFVPAPEKVDLPYFAKESPVRAMDYLNQELRAGRDVVNNEKVKEKTKALLDQLLSAAVARSLRAFQKVAQTTKRQFLKLGYDTFSEGLEKVRSRVVRVWWNNQSLGSSTLIAVAGPSGTGKSTSAVRILNELRRSIGTEGGKAKGMDDWMYQQEMRPPATKYMTGEFQQAMRALKEEKAPSVATPMLDDQSGGNLLFGRGEKDEIIFYNGTHAVVIRFDGERYAVEEWKINKKTGEFVERAGEPRTAQTGPCRLECVTTPVEIEAEQGRLRIAVRGNDHWVDSNLKMTMPNGEVKDLKALQDRESILKGSKEVWAAFQEGEAIWAQDLLRRGLVVIEGTRVLNDPAIGGVAEGGEFAAPGLFDETIEIGGTSFEARRVRAVRRTQERGRGLGAVEREIRVFTEKQAGSERKNIPAGRRARLHMAVESSSESVWQTIQSGELTPDSRFASGLRDQGIDAREAIEATDQIAEGRIIQVLLDHVAKTGVITYPGDKARFASPTSRYDTFIAGFLEIKVSRGESELDEEPIANYESLKQRGRRILDPGQIVDLSKAGPLPIDRGNGVEYLTFGKVLVQNHILWLEEVWRELLTKAKGNESKAETQFRRFIDKFFNLQHLMWRRGIVDTNPDLMWRYGALFIEGKRTGPDEEVVATSPSTMRTGPEALVDFDPEVYRNEEILRKIPTDSLRRYYLEHVQRRIFDVLGDDARRTLFSNFFENDLPPEMRTVEKEFPAEQADQEGAIRNIGVTHPYIDSAQIDYLTQWILISDLRQLRAHHFPDASGVGTPPLVWTKLVLEALEEPNSHFYRLLHPFYQLLLDDPTLLDRFSDDQDVFNLVQEAYERPYLEKKEEVPLVGRYGWAAFAFFLDQARHLGDAISHRPATPSPGEFAARRRERAKQGVDQALERGYDEVIKITPGVATKPAALLVDAAELPAAGEFQAQAAQEATIYEAVHLPEEVSSDNAAVTLMKIAREKETVARRIFAVSAHPEGVRAARIADTQIVGAIPPQGTLEERKALAHTLIDSGADVVVTGFSQTRKLLDATGLRLVPPSLTDRAGLEEQRLKELLGQPILTREQRSEAVLLACQLCGFQTPEEFQPRRPTQGIIVAAGKGRRLQEAGISVPKALLPIDGKPLLFRVLDAFSFLQDPILVIVNPDAQAAVKEALKESGYRTKIVVADAQGGPYAGLLTPDLKRMLGGFEGDLLFSWVDVPLIRPETLKGLLAIHQGLGSRGYTYPTVIDPDAREQGPQRFGVHAASAADLFQALTDAAKEVEAHPGLPFDSVPLLKALSGRTLPIVAAHIADPEEALDVDTPAERTRVESYLLLQRLPTALEDERFHTLLALLDRGMLPSLSDELLTRVDGAVSDELLGINGMPYHLDDTGVSGEVHGRGTNELLLREIRSIIDIERDIRKLPPGRRITLADLLSRHFYAAGEEGEERQLQGIELQRRTELILQVLEGSPSVVSADQPGVFFRKGPSGLEEATGFVADAAAGWVLHSRVDIQKTHLLIIAEGKEQVRVLVKEGDISPDLIVALADDAAEKVDILNLGVKVENIFRVDEFPSREKARERVWKVASDWVRLIEDVEVVPLRTTARSLKGLLAQLKGLIPSALQAFRPITSEEVENYLDLFQIGV